MKNYGWGVLDRDGFGRGFFYSEGEAEIAAIKFSQQGAFSPYRVVELVYRDNE